MKLLNLLKKKPVIRELVSKSFSKYGRSGGKIVVRHKQAGLYTNWHMYDNHWLVWNMPAVVVAFERDRRVRAYLALLAYPLGVLSYVRARAGQTIGDVVVNGWNVPVRRGNGLPLASIPLNIKISSIESYPGSGAKYVIAPGTFARIFSRTQEWATIILPNGTTKSLDVNCMAVVGRVSNVRWSRLRLRKAGQSRWMGKRPIVRGVAKNPVDHPHGGGKGKKSKNTVPEPPWGRLGARKKRIKKDVKKKI